MTPRLSHFAINTDDVERTQAFYGSVFGWEFHHYGPPDFVQIVDETSRTPFGAIQQRRQLLKDEPTRGFECTFEVDDVAATREQIIAAGGEILMEQSSIPNVGYLIAFQDPGGNPALAMQYDSSAE